MSHATLDVSAFPAIAAVDNQMARPVISVVIPTYEPGPFLIDTIKSVLAQDIGSDRMQIAVIDDGSRRNLPSDVLSDLNADDRIEYHEHADNVGLAGNWNRAISHARGKFVHILHQDDTVRTGFYARLLAGMHPDATIGMAFCRHAFITETGEVQRISHRERWRPGVLSNWCERLSERQRVQCPAAIVRRDAYERVGGFRTDLHYALDWEMWVRIACRYAVWYEPQVLANYRRHASAETARLKMEGHIAADLVNAIELMSQHLPARKRIRLKESAYRRLVHVHSRQALKLLKKQSDSQAAANQLASARAALNALSDGLAKRWLQLRLRRLERDIT
jgi:GT2 family glycosyltransferase